MLHPQEIRNRIDKLLEVFNDANEDEQKAYRIQMRTLVPSDRTLRIDADGLLYYAAYSPAFKPEDSIEGSFKGIKIPITLKDVKKVFEMMVNEIVDSCEIESFKNNLPRFNDYELIFTPSKNFRYDIFPDYKKSRLNKPQSATLKRLKKWAKKNHTIAPGIEADDLVYYYAMKGDPVASGDKDVVNGVPAAYFYHGKHKEVIVNSIDDINRWVLLQTLAGDSSDDIPGIKGMGLKTAEKLLPEFATFEDVVKIYEDKGYSKEDAILTRRLVGLDQWDGEKVVLYGKERDKRRKTKM